MTHLPNLKDIRALVKPFPTDAPKSEGDEYKSKIAVLKSEVAEHAADIPDIYELQDMSPKTQRAALGALERRTLFHGQLEYYERALDRIQISHRDSVRVRREDPVKTDLYRVLDAGHVAVTGMHLPMEFHRFYFAGGLRVVPRERPPPAREDMVPTRPLGTLEDLWQNMMACGFLVPPTPDQLAEGTRDLLLEDDQICTYALRLLSRYISRWLPPGIWTGMNEARFKVIMNNTLDLTFSQNVYPMMESFLKFDPSYDAAKEGTDTFRVQAERTAWLSVLGEYYALVCVFENTDYDNPTFRGMYDKFIDFCVTSLKDSVEARLDAFLTGRIAFSEADYGRFCGDRAVCEIAQLLDAPKEKVRLLDVLTVDPYLGYEFVHWVEVKALTIPQNYKLLLEVQERQAYLGGKVRSQYPVDVEHAKALKLAFQRLNMIESGSVNVIDGRISQVLARSRFREFLVGYRAWARRVYLFPHKGDTELTPDVMRMLEEQGGVQIVPTDEVPKEPLTSEIAAAEADKRIHIARLLGTLDWEYWSRVPRAMSIIRAGGTPEKIVVIRKPSGRETADEDEDDIQVPGEDEGEDPRPLKKQAVENARDMDEPSAPSPLPVSVAPSDAEGPPPPGKTKTKIKKKKRRGKGKDRGNESMQVLVNPREFKVITDVEVRQPKLEGTGETRWDLIEQWQSSTVDFTIFETAVFRENTEAVPAPTGASILAFMRDMRTVGYIEFPTHTRLSTVKRKDTEEPYVFTHYEWEDLLLQVVRDITKMKDKWVDLLCTRIGAMYAHWNGLSKVGTVTAGDSFLSSEGRGVSTRLKFILARLLVRVEKSRLTPARIDLYVSTDGDTRASKSKRRGKREDGSVASTEDGEDGEEEGEGESEEASEAEGPIDEQAEGRELEAQYTSEDLRKAYHPFTTMQWYELYHRVVHSQLYAYSAARREEVQERELAFFDGGANPETMAEEEDSDPVVDAVNTAVYREDIRKQPEVDLLITRVGPSYVMARGDDEGPVLEPVPPPRRYLLIGAGVRSSSFQQYVLQRLRDVAESSLYMEYTFEGRTAEQWYKSFKVTKALYGWVYGLFTDSDVTPGETTRLDPQTMDSIVQTLQAFSVLRGRGRIQTDDLPIPSDQVWSVLNAGIVDPEHKAPSRALGSVGYSTILAIPDMDSTRHIVRRLYEVIYMRFAARTSDPELLIQGGEETNHLDTLWRLCQLVFTRAKPGADTPATLDIHGDVHDASPEQRRNFTYWAALFLIEHGRDITYLDFETALFSEWGRREWTSDSLVALVEHLRALLHHKLDARRVVGSQKAVTMLEDGEFVPVHGESAPIDGGSSGGGKSFPSKLPSTFSMLEEGHMALSTSTSTSTSTAQLGQLVAKGEWDQWRSQFKRAAVFNGLRSQTESSSLWPGRVSVYGIWKARCTQIRTILSTDPGYNGATVTKMFALLFVYQWMVPRNLVFMVKCLDTSAVVTRDTLKGLVSSLGLKVPYDRIDATGDDGTDKVPTAVLVAVNPVVITASPGSPVKSPTKGTGQRESPPSTPVSRPSKAHGKDEA